MIYCRVLGHSCKFWSIVPTSLSSERKSTTILQRGALIAVKNQDGLLSVSIPRHTSKDQLFIQKRRKSKLMQVTYVRRPSWLELSNGIRLALLHIALASSPRKDAYTLSFRLQRCFLGINEEWPKGSSFPMVLLYVDQQMHDVYAVHGGLSLQGNMRGEETEYKRDICLKKVLPDKALKCLHAAVNTWHKRTTAIQHFKCITAEQCPKPKWQNLLASGKMENRIILCE